MKATYWQRGESLDYFNDTSQTIEAGEALVLGKRIGVAGTDIQPGETGSVAVVGVFEMPKDDKAVAMGAPVYYDAENGNVTATKKDVVAGYAAQSAEASEGTAFVKLLG